MNMLTTDNITSKFMIVGYPGIIMFRKNGMETWYCNVAPTLNTIRLSVLAIDAW